MGYDLHVVRSLDWTEASEAPITKANVDALIDVDPELTWSTSDYVDMADKSGRVTRYYMIVWKGTPCFWWYRDQILCKGPDDRQIAKLVRIAAALNARAVGDDFEVYELRKTLFGRDKVVFQHRP